MIRSWLEDEDYNVFWPRYENAVYLPANQFFIKIFTIEDQVFLEYRDNRTQGVFRVKKYDIRHPDSIPRIKAAIDLWLEDV